MYSLYFHRALHARISSLLSPGHIVKAYRRQATRASLNKSGAVTDLAFNRRARESICSAEVSSPKPTGYMRQYYQGPHLARVHFRSDGQGTVLDTAFSGTVDVRRCLPP